MKMYCIRHKRTRNLLPIEFATGGSYWDGEAGKAPRLFTSIRNARSFIAIWAKGKASNVYGTVSDGLREYEDKVGLEFKDVGRSKTDCEVIEITLVYERVVE